MAHIKYATPRTLLAGAFLLLCMSIGAPHAEMEDQGLIEESPTPRDTRIEVVLPRDHNGNYMGDGEINGTDVRFLVDTGASMVVVPEAIASRIGLRKGKAMNFRTGGGLVTHYATELDTLRIGRIQISDTPAAINPEMKEEFVLLGMSALSLLQFSQEGDNLVLSYDAGPSATPLPRPPELRFQRSLNDCIGKGNVIDEKTLACLKGGR